MSSRLIEKPPFPKMETLLLETTAKFTGTTLYLKRLIQHVKVTLTQLGRVESLFLQMDPVSRWVTCVLEQNRKEEFSLSNGTRI